MNQWRVLGLCIVVAVLSSTVSVAALEFTDTRAESIAQQSNSISGAEAPGETFSIAVGVQGVKVTELIENRTLDAKLTEATTDGALASIIAVETQNTSKRLDALSARYEMLSDRNTSGDEARMAVLRAEGRMLDHRIQRLSQAAATLPADMRTARGITDHELSALSTRASALGNGRTGAADTGSDGQNVTTIQSQSEPTTMPPTTGEPSPTPESTSTATSTHWGRLLRANQPSINQQEVLKRVEITGATRTLETTRVRMTMTMTVQTMILMTMETTIMGTIDEPPSSVRCWIQ